MLYNHTPSSAFELFWKENASYTDPAPARTGDLWSYRAFQATCHILTRRPQDVSHLNIHAHQAPATQQRYLNLPVRAETSIMAQLISRFPILSHNCFFNTTRRETWREAARPRLHNLSTKMPQGSSRNHRFRWGFL